MAFNGSGTFNRVHNWQDDADNAIDIEPDRHDEEDDGFATGLSNCVTKDGQTTITANLPMAGFRHTGVGNASARTHYLATAQAQDSSVVYVADSGAANAYVMTLAPAITAYAAGQRFHFKATNANTGFSTLAVNGLTATSIKRRNGNDLVAGDIGAGAMCDVMYDGTNFILMSDYSPTTAMSRGGLFGLGMAHAADTDHDITIAVGQCRDSTNVYNLVLGTAITKQIDATFAAGTNAGGMFTGSVANNTTYHVFLIRKTSDGVIDAGFDTSVSAANIPSGYVAFRRIGSVRTDSSANIRQFIQDGDYFEYKVPIVDVSAITAVTTDPVTQALTLPTGLVLDAVLMASLSDTGTVQMLITPLDVTATAPSSTAFNLAVNAGATLDNQTLRIRTNTSAQIRYESSATPVGAFTILTFGWYDRRGKDS